MMTGEYDVRLVILSILVAVFASYTALDLAGRLVSAYERKAYGWLVGGALAMGTGIWSMHFVAMLAFSLPIRLGYDITITFFSWLMAVMASGLALFVIGQNTLSWGRLLAAGLMMGIAICGMHYTGMAAMRMQPGIDYDPLLFGASALIAFIASMAAMWICFTLRNVHSFSGSLQKLGAALVMGLAIAGMHYTGMAAAHFSADAICLAASDLDSTWLAVLIAVATFALLGITLVVSVLDQRLESRTSQLVHSLSEANAKLLHRSMHDPLTNLPNRMLLEDRIKQSIYVATREHSKFALVYMDLDGFKAVNDNLGHQVGDALLKEVSQLVADSIRSSDTIARVGGDEFVLLINDLKNEQAVISVCSKVLSVIQHIRGIGPHRFGISASMGIAICPDDGVEPSRLLAHADTAMYHVKSSGKNGYQFFQEQMNSDFSEEFQIQTELREAISTDVLELYYQPKLSTDEQQLVGAEALLRWNRSSKGQISPARFIPIAEKFGLIFDLDQWVLEHACKSIRHWLDHGLKVPPISINLSALRLRQKDLVEQVEHCLQHYQLDPAYLVFEITETAEMQDILQAIEVLARLNLMGIHVALDDFGTGYSSLTHLKLLPMQQLKIDRSFISDLTSKPGQAEIVESIINLAHALQLKVVAEGVETEEQLAHLQKVRCDEVQGFLLSKPLPEERFVQLLRQYSAG
ncbi:hypothetical protein C4K68_07280 [Pokkaliibacter plantistimulans]|uniref:Bifunctional diguanylate cyclase/phosphodiesterase n=2 Tax=Pseudomonadota TaxID=1224 RepID=A0A2S5KT76_9PROT|nr:hypothetical protein C4K68_07280 [Pokkaliibacter plantistimulans]